MKSCRCSRVARSRTVWTASINMALIYSNPSLERQTTAQQLAVTNDAAERCCPLLLGVAACFPVSEFHFIEQCAIVCHRIIALNKVIGWNKQMGSSCVRTTCVCVCAHWENESHFVMANRGCGQQYKHFKQAIHSAMVECRNTDGSLDEYRMLLKGISSIHIPAAYKWLLRRFVRSILREGTLTFRSGCQ